MSLWTSLWNVIVALADLLIALLVTLAPWTPLLAWIAFWLLAVNWRRLYPVLMQGGWIGVALLGLVSVLVWSCVSVPPDGSHQVGVLHVSNFTGKLVYVTGLIVIASLCGSVQLSGWCGRLTPAEGPAASDEDHHAHH